MCFKEIKNTSVDVITISLPTCVITVYLLFCTSERRGDLLASCWTPNREALIRALAWVILLCSWVRHLNLTVSLSSPEYKWVPAKCQAGQGNLTKCWGWVTCDRLASLPGSSCSKHVVHKSRFLKCHGNI